MFFRFFRHAFLRLIWARNRLYFDLWTNLTFCRFYLLDFFNILVDSRVYLPPNMSVIIIYAQFVDNIMHKTEVTWTPLLQLSNKISEFFLFILAAKEQLALPRLHVTHRTVHCIINFVSDVTSLLLGNFERIVAKHLVDCPFEAFDPVSFLQNMGIDE